VNKLLSGSLWGMIALVSFLQDLKKLFAVFMFYIIINEPFCDFYYVF